MKELLFHESERRYARQYIRSHKRLLVILLVILLLMMIPDFLPSQIIRGIITIFLSSYINNDAIGMIYVFMICIAVLAFLLPLYQFRFMMKRDSCDLYMSLPIKRSRLCYVQYCIGALILVLSTSLVAFFCLMLISRSSSIFMKTQLIPFIIGMEILGVALYTFYCWLMIKCNSLLDAIMVSLTYTILPLIAIFAVRIFTERICNMILLSTVSNVEFAHVTDFIWGLGNFVSPILAMRSLVTFMQQGSELYISGYNITFYVWMSIVYWILFMLVLYRSTRTSFMNRKGEDSERKTDAFMTYPILIPLLVVTLLCLFGTENIIVSFILFVLYLCMCCFAQRKIKFTIGMIARYIILFLCMAGLTRILVETNVFHTVYEIPPIEHIIDIDMKVNYVIYDIGEDEYSSYVNENTHIEYQSSSLYQNEQKIKTLVHGIELLSDYANKNLEWYEYKQIYSVVITYEIAGKDKGRNEFIMRNYRIANDDTQRFASLMKQWELEGINFTVHDFGKEIND